MKVNINIFILTFILRMYLTVEKISNVYRSTAEKLSRKENTPLLSLSTIDKNPEIEALNTGKAL